VTGNYISTSCFPVETNRIHRAWVNPNRPVVNPQDNTYHLLLTGSCWKKNRFFKMQCSAKQGRAGQGKGRVGQGRGKEGKGREGKGREGKARQGKARRGEARRGEARRGEARQGKARQVFLLVILRPPGPITDHLMNIWLLSCTLLATDTLPLSVMVSIHSPRTLYPISPSFHFDFIYSVGLINTLVSSVKQLL